MATQRWTENRWQRYWASLDGPRMERVVRRWQRWTVGLGLAFISNVLVIVPFLDGNRWHGHWNEIGKALLLMCFPLFIAFVFVGGFTLDLWTRLRAIKQVERTYIDQTHGISR